MAEHRRVNIRGILADPDLRRDLMVPTLQATQAREGIETTREQAERAYYIVTEAERATFIDLERFRAVKGQQERRHEAFVDVLLGALSAARFDVARRDFAAIDGSPLAYNRIGLVAHLFREAPALDPVWGAAAQGLATAADERFTREWWEVGNPDARQGSDWVPFAKGGEFSRFYANVHLVVSWRDKGKAIRAFEGAFIRNEPLYFKSGLTWPLRTQRGFNLRALPAGCIFGHKGPAIIPIRDGDIHFILGISNSAPAEYLLRGLMSFGSWEVGVIKRLPIPQPNARQHETIGRLAREIHDAKASWDEGNQTSTRFRSPWLLREDLLSSSAGVAGRLQYLADVESREEARIQALYAEVNDEAFKLYGIPAATRAVIEESLGERPPEILWAQMEGATAEQRRMEHVFRLLAYLVKRVVEADDDGVVPFAPMRGEPSLLERVTRELAAAFPQHDVTQVEAEIANELKESAKSYRRTASIGEWLENAFFEYHAALYKDRPIFWHIASAQGTKPAAFGALVHYHRFDKNLMAKLRGTHLRDAIETFRREAALAEREGRAEDRVEWQAKREEAEELDRRLQWIQEGHHEGEAGGDRDFRILTPWKKPDERPRGWDPDIDDGVKVNIAPFRKAGVLRA